MPFQPVLEPQPLLLVPPLLPPLALRTENGFFGAPRGNLATFGDCPPCARFEEPPFPPPDEEEPDDDEPEPDDPRPPTRFVQAQVHEAVDLEGEAGDCVFAAYAGRVVEVVTSGGIRGHVSIDHHPVGTGLVSRYLHLDGDALCVERGDAVAKGDLIGRLGTGPADPHLHFELRIVLDRSERRFWTDRNSVGVDPTRLLYRFEADALPVLQAAAATVTSIGVQTVAKVPLFRAGTDASDIPFSIPLYEPVTEHERAMAAVFTEALELGRQVAVEYRESRFFGDHRVPVSVHLV